MDHNEIARLLRISRASISNWLRMYKTGGLETVKALKYRKKWGKLTSHQETIEAHFRKNPPKTVQKATLVVKELIGLERKRNSIHRFLKIMGLSYRKTRNVPGKQIL